MVIGDGESSSTWKQPKTRSNCAQVEAIERDQVTTKTRLDELAAASAQLTLLVNKIANDMMNNRGYRERQQRTHRDNWDYRGSEAESFNFTREDKGEDRARDTNAQRSIHTHMLG